jgi:formylglycine-generating enzyme required for sulfatase activity
MNYLVPVVAAIAIMFGDCRLEASGDKKKFLFYNTTSSAVGVWVNNQYMGLVAAQTKTEIVEPVDAEGTAPFAVTGISDTEDGYRINALWVHRCAEQSLKLVWGGVNVPEKIDSKEADATNDALNGDLFAKRWKALQRGLPGMPFVAEETLIGTDWKERRVRGGVLAMHAGQTSAVVNSIGMLLKWIPPGSFEFAQGHSAAQRKVTLTQGFYMAVTETTEAQWRMLMGRIADTGDKNLEQPKGNVNWGEATRFSHSIADVPEWRYRLPTEAQWEYACKAGKSVPFSPSGVDVRRIMWFSGNSGFRAHPVGQLLANDFGLHDMHGNVREWCRDWWSPAPTAGTDPVGPATGSQRVRRGGAYDTPEGMCTSGGRDAAPPDMAWPWLGFRMVLERR